MSTLNEYKRIRTSITDARQCANENTIASAIHLRKMMAFDDKKIHKAPECVRYYVLYRMLAHVAFGTLQKTTAVEKRIEAEKNLCDIEYRWARTEYNKAHKIKRDRATIESFYDPEFHGVNKIDHQLVYLVGSADPFGIPTQTVLRCTDEYLLEIMDDHYIQRIRTCMRQMNDMLNGRYEGVSGVRVVSMDDNEDVDDVIERYETFLKKR